jgi:DNA-binding transcriptional ArsR family regulator
MSDVDAIVAHAQLLSCRVRVSLWCAVGPAGARPGELAQMFHLAPATVTYHLSRLLRAKLVEVSGAGKFRVYRWTTLQIGFFTQHKTVVRVPASTHP